MTARRNPFIPSAPTPKPVPGWVYAIVIAVLISGIAVTAKISLDRVERAYEMENRV